MKKTTDSIVADLERTRAERLKAGELVDADRITQQIQAHRALALLRSERAEALKRDDAQYVGGLEAQIRHWLAMVDDDVDEPAAETDVEGAEPRAKKSR